MPTIGRAGVLGATLDGIGRQLRPGDELIVVDQDGSGTTVVATMPEELRARVRVLSLRPASLTLARNLGLDAASADVVVFCDDDVILDAGFLEAHVAAYEDSRVVAVAGRVVDPVVSPAPAGPEPTGRLRADGSFTTNFDSSTPQEVDFGMGCNMSFRRAAAVAAGGFDERFTGTFYREEGDMFRRVKAPGSRVLFVPAASLTHLRAPAGGCRGLAYRERLFSTFRNETLFGLRAVAPGSMPAFVTRVAHWIYAEARSGGGLRDLAYFAGAPLAGAAALAGQDRRRLTRVRAPMPADPPPGPGDVAVSVVVPVRDRAAQVPRLLAALDAQDLGGRRFEVLLVDDASTDGSLALLERWAAVDPGARRVFRGLGRGPGHARNIGIRHATGAVVAFTDSDTVPTSSWLSNGLAAIETTGADAVEGAIHAESVGAEGPFAHRVRNTDGGRYMTANMFYRRDALELLGGFDERFAQFLEDSDLAFRALERGMSIHYAPEALVYHEVRHPTTAQLVRGTWRLHWVPLFAAKHPEMYRRRLRPVVRPVSERDRDVVLGLASGVLALRVRGLARAPFAVVAGYGLVRALQVARLDSPPRRGAPARGAIALALPVLRVGAFLAGCVRFRKIAW